LYPFSERLSRRDFWSLGFPVDIRTTPIPEEPFFILKLLTVLIITDNMKK
jgi:hypothetical protein